MIDLHSHLDLYENALKLLPLVSKRNVFTLVVTTSPRAWEATSRVFAGFDNIKIALGLHPEIAQKKKNELELLLSSIHKTRFLGEIGLDNSPRFRDSLELQKAIFNDVLAESERLGGRIISIHSRGAATQVLDVLEKYPRAGKPIMHWFSGSIREVQRAISIGCWFSVSPAMLRSAKGLRLLKELPINKILPETDGPFTTQNSAPYMPWEAMQIIPEMHKLSGLSHQELCLQMKSNLATLLGEDLSRDLLNNRHTKKT